VLLCAIMGGPGRAAPYAAMVMDARTGEVLHSRNADTRLHPASLTKMMTLYIAFEAVEHGEISLDTLVTVSRKAASEPPSRLGLRPGQKIKLRYLIRAAAVKSANDAATAIAEAIEGSEAAFARRMNRTAKALGMTRTTFKNAHGLTEAGHLSTARDMTILGRHILYDYPEYYNLFSRRSTDAGLRTVSNTNRRFLSDYRGADGIKTGYTKASGFNLVASAERGGVRIIATMFGGRSTAQRNARVAELLDLGFKRAPARVAFRPPKKPPYGKAVAVASAGVTAVGRSPRPLPRPRSGPALPEALIAAIRSQVTESVETTRAAVSPSQIGPDPAPEAPVSTIATVTPPPRPTPESLPASAIAELPDSPGTPALERAESAGPIVVTRVSTSGGRLWGINVGRYSTRYRAEQVLLRTALSEIGTLGDALRKVVQTGRGFEANFVGMSREAADLACRRLTARGLPCETIGPQG
jgi:D-alanyl-D-alanine carboxypeptidase